MAMIRKQLYIEPEQQRKLQKLAARWGCTEAEVVRTAIGLPPESAKGSIDSQAKAIQSKLDIASLQDSAKLDQFIKRFTIRWDAKSDPAPTPALSLLTGSGGWLDSDVLLSLQNIRQRSF